MAKFQAPPATAAPKSNLLDQPTRPLERTRQAWYSVVQRRLNAVGLSPNSREGNELVPPLKTERDAVIEKLPKGATKLQIATALAQAEAALAAARPVDPPEPPEQPAGDVNITKLWLADP